METVSDVVFAISRFLPEVPLWQWLAFILVGGYILGRLGAYILLKKQRREGKIPPKGVRS